MKRTAWMAIIAIILGATAYYYVWTQRIQAPAPSSPPQVTAPQAALPAPAPSEPVIRHPLAVNPESAQLPQLDRSDGPFLKALGEALNGKWLAILLTDRVIRRIVATVDNLPRKQLPADMVPLKPPPGAFVTIGKGDSLAIAPRNSERYIVYARLARAVDAARLVRIYAGFYPLFQRAYEDLGYPHAYFNDRLVDTIDDLLAAPEPGAAIKLAQPGVLYEYADADLEARSAGQKIMIRLGRDNAAQVKAKLREIRRRVAGDSGTG